MSRQPLDVLAVDEDDTALERLASTFGGLWEYRVGFSGLSTWEGVFEELTASEPHLLVLEHRYAGTDGVRLVQRLRANGFQLPILVVTGHGHERVAAQITRAGADAYLPKGELGAQSLREAVQIALSHHQERLREHRLLDEFRRLATSDPLTGTHNRWVLRDRLEKEWARALRRAEHLCGIFVDIDYFKRYNDQLGHLEGDRCLARVGRALSGLLRRPDDLIARYGGEEFLLLLPGTDSMGGRHVAERLRRAVEDLAIPHPASPISPYVTVSCGVAAMIPDPQSARSSANLVRSADAALYRAKNNGKNRVELHLRPFRLAAS